MYLSKCKRSMAFGPEYVSNMCGQVSKSIPMSVRMCIQNGVHAPALHQFILTVKHKKTGPTWQKDTSDKSLAGKKKCSKVQNSTYNTGAANKNGVSCRYWQSHRSAIYIYFFFHILFSWKDPEETVNSVYLGKWIAGPGREDNLDFCFLSSWVYEYPSCVYILFLNKLEDGSPVDKNFYIYAA